MGKEEKLSGPGHWNRVVIPARVTERAYKRWEADGDCWISTYSTASHGYAQIGWQNPQEKHVVLAHRAAWEHINGPVPAGMTIDHLCKQRRCVNPSHLRVLDNYENARRTQGRDWPLGECINGHSNEHLKDYDNGRRHCSICASEIWKSGPRGSRGVRAVKSEEPTKLKAPRTHCRNGHEKTPENSYRRPNGVNECLPCKQEYAKVWVNRKNAA